MFLFDCSLSIVHYSFLMTYLENDQLRISIDPQGAQLSSLFDKATGTEHLWQADPAVWPWHAPNLFPIVGGLKNNELLIERQTYPMNRHGFARQSLFAVTEATPTRARFQLTDTEQTRAVYPYHFVFELIYQLTDNQLAVTFQVDNRDEKPVWFSVGAHPAFRVPFGPDESYEAYYIEFEYDELLQTHLLSASGLFSGEVQSVPLANSQLSLTRHLFDRDALVFKNIASRRVTLRSRNHAQAIALHFADFPYLGIWAKPGADFVCIEPWLGCADSEGNPVPIQHKEAIQQLGIGQRFAATFSIEVLG